MTASSSVITIDTGFMAPEVAASFLLRQDGRGAFIETGPALAVPRLLAALADQEMDRGDVDWVIVTHVHLDHAGGAGALLAELPNARLAVHPRGARHLVDPSKLVAGATAVYGEALLQAHYGTVVPAPAERVVEIPEGAVLELAGRPLSIIDTPGHAKHHVCIWDEATRGWFTGDTFGLSYRPTDTAQGPFIFPTTSPVQFDPPALRASMDRLMARDPQRMYLTHYGAVGDPPALARRLHTLLDAFIRVAETHAAAADPHRAISDAVGKILLDEVRAHGCELDDAQLTALFAMDIELNVQGLRVWLDRRPPTQTA